MRHARSRASTSSSRGLRRHQRRARGRGGRRDDRRAARDSLDWGVDAADVGAEVQERVAEYLARTARLPSVTVDVVVAGRRRDGRLMRGGVSGLTRATIGSAPGVCRDCVWWQSRGNRTASKDALDRARRGGLRRVGDDLPRRRRSPARLDAVRAVAPLSSRRRPARGPGVGRRRPRDLRLPHPRRRRVDREVAPPRRDRRVARPRREGDRGVRLPLSGGRVGRGALPRPPHRVPARLPRRVRVH